jgi:hypothetical protein
MVYTVEIRLSKLERIVDRVQDRLDTVVNRIITLESENYDSSKVKSALREIREHLQDTSQFFAFTRLEDLQ